MSDTCLDERPRSSPTACLEDAELVSLMACTGITASEQAAGDSDIMMSVSDVTRFGDGSIPDDGSTVSASASETASAQSSSGSGAKDIHARPATAPFSSHTPPHSAAGSGREVRPWRNAETKRSGRNRKNGVNTSKQGGARLQGLRWHEPATFPCAPSDFDVFRHVVRPLTLGDERFLFLCFVAQAADARRRW
jgi:hypothetical protein